MNRANPRSYRTITNWRIQPMLVELSGRPILASVFSMASHFPVVGQAGRQR